MSEKVVVVSTTSSSSLTASETETAKDCTESKSVTKRSVPLSNGDKTVLWKFQIKNIVYDGDSSADEFDVLLNPSVHGIYDLIDVVFEHSLTKLTTEGWTVDSHLWTTDYGNKNFVNCHIEKSIWGLYDKTPHLCTDEEPRVFGSSEMKKKVGCKKGTKGYFSLDLKPLMFQFTLVDVNIAINKENESAVQDPKCVATSTVSTIIYTPNKEAEYVTPEEHNAVAALTRKYAVFYSGMNAWSMDRRMIDWKPARPQPPAWTSDENEIIALFMLGGWKFSDSWKFGLQYACPHRTKAATQGNWYKMKKNPYIIKRFGKHLKSSNDKIIRAKKLCREFMDDLLEQGAPKAPKKPMSFKRLREEMIRAIHHDDDSDIDADLHHSPSCVLKKTREAHLPKRLRTGRY